MVEAAPTATAGSASPIIPVSTGGDTDRPSSGQAWRWLASLIIVLVVAAALLVKVSPAVNETDALRSPSNVALSNLRAAYFSCLSHQVESLVPPGRPVWVSTHTPKIIFPAFQLQQVVAPYAPLEPRSAGLVRLYLVKARHNKGCLGARVKGVWPNGTVRFGVGPVVRPVHTHAVIR